MISPR